MSLLIYILKKIIYSIPIVIGVTVLIFLIFNIIVGDPTVMILGKHSTAEEVAMLKHQLGLDKPFYLQYLDVLKSTFTMSFGRSWATNQSIATMIKSGALVSLTIAIPAIILSSIFSIILAFISSVNSSINKYVSLFCTITMSISYLSYILVFQWIFAFKLNIFPISGYEYGFPKFVPYIILPILIWTFINFGKDTRFYKTLIKNELKQKYIITARSKGFSEWMIFYKHIFQNIKISFITNIVIQIPILLLQAVLTENFFGLPGLGKIILDGINYSDFPVIKAMTILSSLLFIFLNIIVDITYKIIDPRVNLK